MTSARNSQVYNQFKNYFTESEFSNPDPDAEPPTKEDLLRKLRKSI